MVSHCPALHGCESSETKQGSGPEGDEVLQSRGTFVPSIRQSPQALSGLKSTISGLKSVLSGLKSALSGLESALLDLKFALQA